MPAWEIPDFETIKRAVIESGISEQEFMRLFEEEKKKLPFLRDNTVAWMVAYSLGIVDKIEVPAVGPRVKGEPVRKTIAELTRNDYNIEVEGYIFGFRHVERGTKSFYIGTLYDQTGKIDVRFYRQDINLNDGEKVLIRGANVFSPSDGVMMLTVWDDADVAVLPGNWEEVATDKLEEGKLVKFIGVCVGERKLPYSACSKCGKKVDGTPGNITKCPQCGTVPVVERVWTNLAVKGEADVLVRIPPDRYVDETFVGKIIRVVGEYKDEVIDAYKVEIYHVPTVPGQAPVAQPQMQTTQPPVQPTINPPQQVATTAQPQISTNVPTQQPAQQPVQQPVQQPPQQPVQQPPQQPAQQPPQDMGASVSNEVTPDILEKVDEIAKLYGEYPGETIAKKILMGKFRNLSDNALTFLAKYWEDKFKEV